MLPRGADIVIGYDMVIRPARRKKRSAKARDMRLLLDLVGGSDTDDNNIEEDGSDNKNDKV